MPKRYFVMHEDPRVDCPGVRDAVEMEEGPYLDYAIKWPCRMCNTKLVAHKIAEEKRDDA